MMEPFKNTTLGELEVLADLGRFSSLRSFARWRKQGVAVLSRTIVRLEKRLKTQIVERSPSGVCLTGEGKKLAHQATRILEIASRLEEDSLVPKPHKSVFRIGLPDFLSPLLAPALGQHCAQKHGELEFEFQSIDADFPGKRAGAERDESTQWDFHLLVHCEELSWGKSWQSYKLGPLEWGFYEVLPSASQAHVSFGVAHKEKSLRPVPKIRIQSSCRRQDLLAKTLLAKHSREKVLLPHVFVRGLEQILLMPLGPLAEKPSEIQEQFLYLSVRADEVPSRLLKSFLHFFAVEVL
jgi:hypothetical protein